MLDLLEGEGSARLLGFWAADFASAFVWNFLWSLAADRLYWRYVPRKKAVLVCADPLSLQRLEGAFAGARCFQIEKTLTADASFEELAHALQPYHTVLTAGLPQGLQNALIEYCACTGRECFLLPAVGDIILAGALPMQSFHVLSYRAGLPADRPEYLLVKRGFDILISLCGAVILSPLMLLCAIVIHCGDGGPVFYRQRRLTRNGKLFWLYKFRSMRVDAEADGMARLSVKDDERVTHAGKWLRATRLDELPQLFNILRGDMSLVGPRPERPEIAERVQAEIPEFKLRLSVKAGLTGYSQVYGKYSTDPYSKLCMDLFYICHRSLSLDLKLLFRTLGIPFIRERADGIEHEGEKTHA